MKFLTFLNSGCIDICKNMLISAENVGINSDDFIVACLDNNSYQELSNYKNAFLYIDQPLVEYQDWTFDQNSGFRNIVKNKWSIIKQVYQEHKNLCWVDTDIVFLKNPLEFITDDEDILFQSDDPGSTLCSGFMVFNGSKICEQLVNECGSNEDEDDQLNVNHVALQKYAEHVSILNPDLFPNGHVYYQQGRKENAVIVHNNWMVGVETKIQKFKEEKLWYL